MSKHPAYGQSLLKLGLHLSDPIVELGTVWVRGDEASARLIHQAILSAEHLRQGRDKMLARVAGSIINKLKSYHSEAVRGEDRRHKSPYAAGSLIGRKNPRVRRDYYVDRELRSAKQAKRTKGRASVAGMRAVLGRMNPPISSKDAAAMCRVLRHHGYVCTKKGAKRSKARR